MKKLKLSVLKKMDDRHLRDQEPSRGSRAAQERAEGYGAHYAALVLLGLVLSVFAEPISAEPQGGQVVGGSATISQTNAQRMDITQHSQRAIIDWSSFSIAQSEHVNFQQPAPTAAALNRVTGPQVSQIRGQLTANGRVFLVNPNGILFGKEARIDVGSLVASTTNIRNDDFMAGRYRFEDVINDRGVVINRGEINVVEGGLVALVAPGVENTGVIRARLGRVVLASANKFTLDFYGDELVSFAVDDETIGGLRDSEGRLLPARVTQSGVIEADGGNVMLATSTAKSVLDNAINMEGIVRARSVAEQNGEIVLLGEGDGQLQVAGTLDTSGRGAGGTGGTVKVLGDEVRLADGASIDATGDAGGGDVRIGGGYQGEGEVRTAKNTTVDSGAQIDADALSVGDGGEVIVWADETTSYSGSISAEGGASGGDGGFVEVSGKGQLDYTGAVSVRAPVGEGGTLLLDPELNVVDDTNAESLSRTLAFGDLILTSPTYINILATLDGRGGEPGGSLTIDAGTNVLFEADVYTNDGDVSVSAGTGSILSKTENSTAVSFTEDSGRTLIATGTGDIALHAASDTAAGEVVSPFLSTTGDATISGYSVDLNNRVVLDGTGYALSVGGLNVSGGPGSVQVSELNADSDVSLFGTGDVSASRIYTGGPITLTGPDVNAGLLFTRREGGGQISLNGSNTVTLFDHIETVASDIVIGTGSTNIVLDPDRDSAATYDTIDAVRFFASGAGITIDENESQFDGDQITWARDGTLFEVIAGNTYPDDDPYSTVSGRLKLEIWTHDLQSPRNRPGDIRFRGHVDIAPELWNNPGGVIGDPDIRGDVPSWYVTLSLVTGTGDAVFEQGLAKSRLGDDLTTLDLTTLIDRTDDGPQYNRPSEPGYDPSDPAQWGFNTVWLAFTTGTGTLVAEDDLVVNRLGLEPSNLLDTATGSGEIIIGYRSKVDVLNSGGVPREVYPESHREGVSPAFPEPPQPLKVAQLPNPTYEWIEPPISISTPKITAVGGGADGLLADSLTGSRAFSLIGSRASKSARETVKQLSAGEEDEEEEDEEKEKESEETAAQVVFPGGRGVAREADSD